jgi:hypothetical protein
MQYAANGNDVQQQKSAQAGCLTCNDYGVDCTMDRPIRKRGRKGTATVPSREQPETSPFDGSASFGNQLHGDELSDGFDFELESVSEANFTSMHVIRRLVRIYHDTMYLC